MRKIIYLKKKAYFISHAAVGGSEEGCGPLSSLFDHIDADDRFGMKSWEMAESEMGRLALNLALGKAQISSEKLDVLLAGDLENQCAASSSGLFNFGVPYLGLYGACSTATEALLILATLLAGTDVTLGATVTTSHNSAAERQFRSPVEYGGQRPPSAQWTATAAGSFILSSEVNSGKAYIDNVMVGKMVDGLTTDASNMGAAMARAAYDSIYTYLSLSKKTHDDFDLIVTGDLGRVGSDMLCDMLEKDFSGFSSRHADCGKMLFDLNKKGINSGASGCGCSASCLAAYFLPKIESGEYKSILFLSTGALMNPQSILQGQSILGIAPVINIKSEV